MPKRHAKKCPRERSECKQVKLDTNGDLQGVSRANDRFVSKIDCWEAIFKFLEWRSRARCEILCEGLRESIEKFWQSETHLDVADVQPTSIESSAWPVAVLGICSQIGISLRTLRMSVDFNSNAETFNSIVRNCQNLERIDFFVSTTELAAVRCQRLRALKEFSLLGWEKKLANRDILSVLSSLPPTLEVLVGLRCLRKKNVGDSSASNLPRETDFVDIHDVGILLNVLVAHPQLKRFEMSYCNFSPFVTLRRISVPLFRTFAESLPRLEHLAVVECKFVDFDGIESLSNLKELKISGSGGQGRLEDEQVVKICNRNPRLGSLRIGDVDRSLNFIAYEAIGTLANLQELEISGSRWAFPSTDFGDACLRTVVENIGRSLRRLSILYSHGPKRLTAKSIDSIAEWCPNLRLLVLRISRLDRHDVSAVALRRLIDCIASPVTGFDSTKEKLEIYVFSEYHWTRKHGAFKTLANSKSLPCGVVVRYAETKPCAIRYLAETVVPVVL